MRKFFWVVLPLILITGSLIGGVFIYRAGIKPEVVPEQPSPSPIPTEVPDITPVALKREDLKLQILNGQGIAGIAGEAKNYLESLGYKEIEVDNADSFDFEETEVSIKKAKENYFDLLKEDLSAKYVTAEKAEILDPESEFDVIVVIGEKAN